MRQLIYVSSAATGVPIDVDTVLATSRRNNQRDGLTGLLYSDGKRYLQVLEGEAAAVGTTLARIEADPRHRAIVILSDRTTQARDFGEWSMAHRRPGTDGDAFVDHVAVLVEAASPSVRATFQGFAEARRGR